MIFYNMFFSITLQISSRHEFYTIIGYMYITCRIERTLTLIGPTCRPTNINNGMLMGTAYNLYYDLQFSGHTMQSPPRLSLVSPRLNILLFCRQFFMLLFLWRTWVPHMLSPLNQSTVVPCSSLDGGLVRSVYMPEDQQAYWYVPSLCDHFTDMACWKSTPAYIYM